MRGVIAGPSSVIGALPRVTINSLRVYEKGAKRRRSLEPPAARWGDTVYSSALSFSIASLPFNYTVTSVPLPFPPPATLIGFFHSGKWCRSFPGADFTAGPAIRERISAKTLRDRRHVPDQRALTRVASVIDNPLRHRVRDAPTMSTMRPPLSHVSPYYLCTEEKKKACRRRDTNPSGYTR